MMTLTPLFLAATLPGFLAYADDPGPRVQVSLAIGKARYVVGEPVDVRVTFTNKDKKAAQVLTFYPMFEEVSVESTDLVAGDGWGGSLSSTPQTIEPGKSWSTRFFLQSYVKTPKPGRHRAKIVFQVQACYPEDFPDGPMTTLKATAEVRFLVEPARPGELIELLRPYDDAIKADGAFADNWASREAVEALSVVDDPAVIPFLFDMLNGLPGDYPYRLIDKFRKSEEAKLIIVKLLRSDDRDKAVWALRRLADWHHVLAVEDVRPFLDSSKAWPRSQALRYLREVRDARFHVFRPEVAKLAESTDAKEAMSALSVLDGWEGAAGAAVPDRLSRAVAALDAAKEDEVRWVLEAAAAWRFDVGRARLEALLKDRKSALANGFAIESYAKAMGRADYSALARTGRNGRDTPK